MWVLRTSIVATAILSVTVAANTNTVYGLCVLCADYLYVILFPQLLASVHIPFLCNVYGSLAAFSVGVSLRLLAGEPLLGLPVLLKFPYYDEVAQEQLFPVKTTIMVVSLATLVVASQVARLVSERLLLAPNYGVVECRDPSVDATANPTSFSEQLCLKVREKCDPAKNGILLEQKVLNGKYTVI